MWLSHIRKSPLSRLHLLLLLLILAMSSWHSPGVAFAAETKPEIKKPKQDEKYNYGQVLYLSSLFYEAQRSGHLPKNNRVPWRGDSALKDGSDVGKDLSGGWYDAGDHVKFIFPMSYTVTVLAWGLHEYWDAYESVDETDRMLDTLRWPLEFILRAHTDKHELFYQVGDGDKDHEFWGPPESMDMKRPSLKINETNPGTEIAGEAAAALAAGALVFKEKDPTYAAKLMSHARQLFEFADKYRGIGSVAYYPSSSFEDELAWGALWLYQATGEKAFLEKAERFYEPLADRPQLETAVFDWNDKRRGVEVLLWRLTGRDVYKSQFEDYMTWWFKLPKLEHGLTFLSEWGSLRFAANMAFLALVGADYGIKPDEYRRFGKQQIDYILGDCCGGVNPDTGMGKFSYIVGMGDNYPKSPHHRSSSCTGPKADDCKCDDNPHPHMLYGAMVGGPKEDGGYEDRCPDYMHNEVATDYNAGVTGAAAALRHLTLTKQMPN